MKIQVYYSHKVPAPGFEKRNGEFVGRDVDEKSLAHSLVWSGSDEELTFDYTNDEQACAAIFHRFNRRQPENFVGEFCACQSAMSFASITDATSAKPFDGANCRTLNVKNENYPY